MLYNDYNDDDGDDNNDRGGDDGGVEEENERTEYVASFKPKSPPAIKLNDDDDVNVLNFMI